MPIKVGEKAPDFTLRGHDDREHTLSALKGQKVVLAFYPLDFSPVCSKEHACFMDDLKQFETLSANVFGISVDSVWAHKAFAEKLGIKYPLLADFQPKGAVAQKYGLYLEDKGITNRATVVIDGDGVVRHVTVHNIPEQRSNAAIMEILKTIR
jgi:mycoredoxin-dependent peroxiredoxin